MKVLIKPKVTNPWSKDMYDYNDKVADMMKNNIINSNLSSRKSSARHRPLINDSVSRNGDNYSNDHENRFNLKYV